MKWGKFILRVLPGIVDGILILNRYNSVPKIAIETSPPPLPFEHSSQSESYCLECAHKHLNTASVLLREALQRLDANEPKERVLEKIRAMVAELTGAEDDTKFGSGEIAELNKRIRALRVKIWNAGYELEPPRREDLIALQEELKGLLNFVYDTAAKRRKAVIELLKKVEERASTLRRELEGRSLERTEK